MKNSWGGKGEEEGEQREGREEEKEVEIMAVQKYRMNMEDT